MSGFRFESSDEVTSLNGVFLSDDFFTSSHCNIHEKFEGVRRER